MSALTNAIYGLKSSKCVVNQRANLQSDVFFVATCHVKGDNEVHLIQAKNDPKFSIQCLKIFRCDYGEITHMATSLTNQDRLFIVGSRKTVLVDMSNGTSTSASSSSSSTAVTADASSDNHAATTPSSSSPSSTSSSSGDDNFVIRQEFVNDSSCTTRQVVWHPDESNEDLVARLTTKAVEVIKLDGTSGGGGAGDSRGTATGVGGSAVVQPTFRRVIVDAELSEQVHWNPHKLSELAYTHNKSIIGVDTRQTGSQTAWRIDDADSIRLKTFDFNPNHLHYLCCGGVDSVVRFYDIRNTSQPSLRLANHHEHWIRAVQYNKFNDKLILTAGSDGIVNVLSVFSASSKLDTDDAQHHHATNEQQQKSSTKDKLAATMTDHTDSVWSATWSAGDPKLFASCSIVGRVICSKLNVAD